MGWGSGRTTSSPAPAQVVRGLACSWKVLVRKAEASQAVLGGLGLQGAIWLQAGKTVRARLGDQEARAEHLPSLGSLLFCSRFTF